MIRRSFRGLPSGEASPAVAGGCGEGRTKKRRGAKEGSGVLLQKCTGVHRSVQECTGICRSVQECTGVHRSL